MQKIKENYKKIIKIIVISIIFLYLIFSIILPRTSAKIYKNNILLIFSIVVIFTFLIITLSLKVDKKTFINFKNLINKYILLKAVVILIISFVLNRFITQII